MSNEGTSEQWQHKARQVSRKINTAWWLQTMGIPLVLTALIVSCAILLARREVEVFPWREVSLGAVGLITLVGIISWLVARRRFESPEHALVRVEASMRLRNSLSAAKAGVAPWPEPPKSIDDGTRWHWPRLLTPLFAAVLFLSLSILLPVSARTEEATTPDEPQAWKDLEADIAELREDDTVQEQYLEELEERVEELRKKDEDEWFSHSSLEATDALKKAHSSELEQLRRKLRQAERSLNALQKNSTKLNDNGRKRLLDDFQDALNGMGKGAMKPNPELLEKLQGLDPQNLGNLDQEQLDQLRENMRQHADKMGQGGQGQGEGGGDGDWIDDLLNEGGEGGDGQGQDGNDNAGEGPDGEGNGRGGRNRGPGSNPNVLGGPSKNLETGEMEGLKSRDLNRSLPGDLLQLMDGEHEVREDKIGIRAGGEATNEGQGGDRVWKDSLLPDEKKALKQFFK